MYIFLQTWDAVVSFVCIACTLLQSCCACPSCHCSTVRTRAPLVPRCSAWIHTASTWVHTASTSWVHTASYLPAKASAHFPCPTTASYCCKCNVLVQKKAVHKLAIGALWDHRNRSWTLTTIIKTLLCNVSVELCLLAQTTCSAVVDYTLIQAKREMLWLYM